jgi:hypothetical protein
MHLSGSAAFGAVKKEMPSTEIASLAELRELLRALALKFGHRHSDHYYKVANRHDVIHHRRQFAPLLLSVLRSKKVFASFADASFFYEDAFSKEDWIFLDRDDGDLCPTGPGKGPRLNAWEFSTLDGILWHSDGTFCYSPFFNVRDY